MPGPAGPRGPNPGPARDRAAARARIPETDNGGRGVDAAAESTVRFQSETVNL